MTITSILNYDTPASFTYDTDKIDLSSGKAKLKLEANPLNFTETFTTDTGFTYDNTKVEFVAGVMRQKLNPSDANAVSAINFDTKDLTWGGGVLTGTLGGDAAVSSNKVTFSGTATVNQIKWASSGNAPGYNTGEIKFKLTPGYSGSPSPVQLIYGIDNGATDVNRLIFWHAPDGDMHLRVYDNAGSQIVEIDTPWSPTASTEYEIAINWDCTNGLYRVYVDGTLFLSDLTGVNTGTRNSTGLTSVRFGTNNLESSASADFAIADYVSYDAVKTTANYTPGYSIPYAYQSSNADLPQDTYSGLGDIQSYDSATCTVVGNPRFTVSVNSGTHQYWTGSAWANSDGTYAQANDIGTINTNLPTLTVAGTTIDRRVHFTDTYTQDSVDDYVFNYTAEDLYYVDNPTIIWANCISMNSLSEFFETAVKTGSDEVKYTVTYTNLTGFPVTEERYWSGAAWVASDGTYAQASTAADIHANLTTLTTLISGGVNLCIKAFLHSDSGSSTPELESLYFTYVLAALPDPAVHFTTVYGFIDDIAGEAVSAATVLIENPNAWYYEDVYIAKTLKRVRPDSDNRNRWEIPLVETVTHSQTYNITITYRKGDEEITVNYTSISIPKQDSYLFTGT